MKQKHIYSSAIRKEFAHPLTYFDEQLRNHLMKIWENKICLNDNDLKILEHLTLKTLFET